MRDGAEKDRGDVVPGQSGRSRGAKPDGPDGGKRRPSARRSGGPTGVPDDTPGAGAVPSEVAEEPGVPAPRGAPGIPDDSASTQVIPPRGAEEPSATDVTWPRGSGDGSATEIIRLADSGRRAGAPQTTDIDSRVAQLAVEMDFAIREAVHVCLDALEQARDHGLKRSLAELLVDQGLVSEEQAAVLVRTAREEAAAQLPTEAPAAVESARATGPAEALPTDLPHGFKVLETIGRGSMGTVYKARQMPIDRVVALKILPEELASDEAFVKRFVREARAAGKLNHPNIVRAFDVGKSGKQYYFAREFVDGRSLGEMLRSGIKIPPGEAVEIATQVARGLECAWENGLVHRDVNPDNILITHEGVAKLADLGLAKQVNVPRASHITHDDVVIGSPDYVSPEQARGEKVDTRSDIYALGATLYHAVTGEPPFRGETVAAVLAARVQELPRPADEVDPEVSPELARVIDKMMATRPEDRYRDPRALLQDLEQVVKRQKAGLAGRPTPARAQRRVKGAPLRVRAARRRRAAVQTAVAGGIALVLVIVGAAALFGRRSAGEPAEAGESGVTARTTRSETSPRVPEGERTASESLRRAEELEAQAAGFYQALVDAYGARAYREVAAKIDAEGARYAQTSYRAKIEKLRSQAAAEVDAAARKAAEEEREQRYKQLVRMARARLEDEEFDAAVKLLTEARTLKGDEEIRELLSEAERGGYLALGKKAERQGAITAALRHYADALRLRDDVELRRHVADLERRARRDRLLERGREAENREDRGAAVASYREALKLGDDPDLREHAAQLEHELRVSASIAEAKAAESRGDLAVAIAAYERALRLKDDSDLRQHLQELDRRVCLARALELARAAAQEGSWASAAGAYRQALEYATDAEKKGILEALKVAETELAYAKAMAEAREAADAEAWKDVREYSRAALAAKPGDSVAATLLERAFHALGPERAITNTLKMDFVLIPAGEFTMGTDRGGERDERPARKVNLPAFYISTREVTNAEFEAFDPVHRSERKAYSSLDEDPVVGVTWYEAEVFCRWLGEKEGVEYRLPTEEEWEKAARGTDARTYPWGEEAPDAGGIQRCNYAPKKARGSWKKDGFEFVAPAGSYAAGASPYGCLNMAGNVWEWCTETVGGGEEHSGERAVLRGGSFSNAARVLRSANRAVVRADFDGPNVGFRCVRVVVRPKQAVEQAKSLQ